MSMKPVLYRVETYIVPEVNKHSVQAAINGIDNRKTINRIKVEHKNISENNMQNKDMSPVTYNKRMEVAKCSVENNRLRKIMKDVTNENQTLVVQEFRNKSFNEDDLHPCNERLNVQNKKFHMSIGHKDMSQESLYPVKQFKRFNSLMSIDERSEASLETNDFCHHGYKNGCTATIPPPEEVSEEIFKDNWLQKIEILRQREALLREKEMNLQSRERELFRREKELRIAERALKDKIKQMNEQELQFENIMQTLGKRLNTTTRILNDEFKELHEPTKAERLRNSQQLQLKSSVSSCEKIDKREEFDKKLKHLTRSRSHLSKQPSSNVTSASHTYASIKYKERPKMCYDDMNSTLSADPGDSSFVRTSERFNPELYKKPSAFTRSASERWTKQRDKTVVKLPALAVEKPERIEEEKVFKKFSENICASQDKGTKFQNYGLVDCRPNDVQSKMERNLNKEGTFSYLDLEINDRHSRQKVTNVSKNRPISWNEEENKWLQKKREAFSQASKKSENKENLKCNIIAEKSGKTLKKDGKNKLFTIFR